LAKFPTSMAVVAGALSDGDGRWLLQRRPAGKRHAGLWEFPGGKVEPGETPPNALVRELNEELTILVDPSAPKPLATAASEAGEGEPAIVITLYKVLNWEGVIEPEPGTEVGWFIPAELAHLALAPLDVELAQALPAMPAGDCQP
jgi:8-oxo-dGTP diphosphatase